MRARASRNHYNPDLKIMGVMGFIGFMGFMGFRV